ncbi:LOW QUALITY PROTEIN: CD226 antigen, partial [Phaethornis superciliosus]
SSWMKLNVTHKANTAVLYLIYDIHIGDKCNGRIYIENASRKDKILSLIKSTLEDVGPYFCSIAIYPDGIWEKVIEIIQPDAFEVSETKSNNPMSTEPGGNVALICLYKIGNSVQKLKWERIADWVDTAVLCKLSGKQSFSSDFKELTMADCSYQSSSMIIIQNIPASDFATYHCMATRRNMIYMKTFIETVSKGGSAKWFYNRTF